MHIILSQKCIFFSRLRLSIMSQLPQHQRLQVRLDRMAQPQTAPETCLGPAAGFSGCVQQLQYKHAGQLVDIQPSEMKLTAAIALKCSCCDLWVETLWKTLTVVESTIRNTKDASISVWRYRNSIIIMDARSASVHVIFYRCFFSYFFLFPP